MERQERQSFSFRRFVAGNKFPSCSCLTCCCCCSSSCCYTSLAAVLCNCICNCNCNCITLCVLHTLEHRGAQNSRIGEFVTSNVALKAFKRRRAVLRGN